MFVLKILLGIAMYLWILWLWSRRRYYKLMLQVPGPIGLPLIGILYKLTSHEALYTWSRKIIRKYKSFLLTWAGPYPIFVIMDPQTIQDILTSPYCVDKKGDLYDPFVDVFGHGILTMPNPDWAAHRKLLNPAFSSTIIRNYMSIFNARTKNFMKEFEGNCRGDSVNMVPILHRVVMNIALETTLGLKSVDKSCSDDENMEEKMYRFYHYLTDRVMSLMEMPWLRLKIIQDILPNFKRLQTYKTELKMFLQNVIHEKLDLPMDDPSKTSLQSSESNIQDISEKKSHSFVDMAIELLRNGKITIDELESHANNILLGASETTALAAAHALMFLAMNPKYQEIAFEEVISLFPDRDDITVNDEDLPKLVYLEMVINETMRLIPPVPFAARRVTNDVRLSCGITLPKGLTVCVDIFDLHRNESVWGPNACVFNPENFLPVNIMDKHPYAFIPFTKGIRSCIGGRYAYKLAKVLLVMLIRKYRFSTTTKFEELRYEPAITIKLVNQPLLNVELREK